MKIKNEKKQNNFRLTRGREVKKEKSILDIDD